MRRKALVGLLLLHGACVLAGAAKVSTPNLGPFNRVVSLYLGLSGAHYSWGFFAPNIGSQFKTDFRIHLADGTELTQSLGSRGPNEALLRETGIAATFWFAMRDEKVRRSLTASWAARLFSENESATKIDVAVSAYYLPSMAQIRAGIAPRWVPVYDVTYGRNQ